MALAPGTRLGPYEITTQIGVGGMGEVYQATDTKLKRQVAIKVLPESVAVDKDRLARFQREAEVLASLNHPHIAAIYGLEDADGGKALVMELVEGEDLAERLKRGAIPVDEAIAIAKQIAEALEAAHEQGIIHRDLKPANIKVREDGTVKVLDFGLAKALEPVSSSSPDVSHSPTLTSPALSQVGMILGTAAYMSPEQARGKAVDKRTDIWAFGVVLYEMLAGQQVFGGGTTTDVLAAILERDPNWSALPVGTPMRIQALLHRCLSKERKQRQHDVGDARLEIDETILELARIRQTAPLYEKAIHSPWPVTLAIVAALVMAVAATWVVRRPAEVDIASSGTPVVILMDTPAPRAVYDGATRARGGTNADDLNDALRSLAVELHKETVSSTWDREDQVLKQRPALILIHRSSFAHSMNLEFGFDQPNHGQEDLQSLLYEIADGKLKAFLGYIGLGNPKTRFIVYSRGFGRAQGGQGAWVADVESRFPILSGRVFAFDVPIGPDGASFRDTETARKMKRLVEEILQSEN